MNQARKELIRMMSSMEARADAAESFRELATREMLALTLQACVRDFHLMSRQVVSRMRMRGGAIKRRILGHR